MNYNELFLLVALALVVTLVWVQFRKRITFPRRQVVTSQVQDMEAKMLDLPRRIVIGDSPAYPLVTIETLLSSDEFETAKPLNDQSSTSISRLSALCQSLPSLMVAGEASGKQLMEVVINGDLVRAANGNGLRAFAMAPDGIKEHARLFDVQNLQNAINVAAFWQVASVVVAQKHLADISEKLDEIKNGVLGISKFLDNQRKSRLLGTYDYIEEIYRAIQGGDFPDAGRHHLENCERDLLEIQRHLELEYRQRVDKQVEHKETFGTEGLTTDINKKIADLDLLVEDIALCLKTRIAAWHVLSLFPGDPQLKLARRTSIQKSIDIFASLAPYYKMALKRDISSVSAFWNSKSTLRARKRVLSSKSSSSRQTLESRAQEALDHVVHSEQKLLNNDHPTHLLLQFESGELIGVRQRYQE